MPLATIDLLLCVSTYRSSKQAIRMIDSLHHIDGDVLCFMTGALEDGELHTIYNHVRDKNCENVIIARSPINCSVFNQSWAVVWAINNGLSPQYACFIDDDVEFTPSSKNILQVVKDCEPFSVCSLANSAMHYLKQDGTRGVLKNVTWLDECGMFVKFKDCVKYGVRDSQPDAPWIFYTGVEYMHRMRYFTGKPTIANGEINYYIHHQRTEPVLQKTRNETAHKAFYYAGRFWKDKFGIDMHINPVGDPETWDKLWSLCSSNLYSQHFKKHLVFDGMWTNWKDIYDRYDVEVIYGGKL